MGLLSGTSMDGITAVVTVPLKKATVLNHIHRPWHPKLKEDFLAYQATSPTPSDRDEKLENKMGIQFGEVALEALLEHDVQGIGFHGQTAAHRPDLGWSLQVGNPSLVAKMTKLPVWSAFRNGDIAAGGQGAPLAPILDHYQLDEIAPPTLRLNLGGIVNGTFLSPKEDALVASDIGLCNDLLDSLWKAHGGDGAFDRGGKETARGRAQDPRRLPLLAHPFLKLPPPKSTHTSAWIAEKEQTIQSLNDLTRMDALASAARLIATQVGDWVKRNCPTPPQEVVLAGGGARNEGLCRALLYRLGLPSITKDPWGDAREGILFAHLAQGAYHALPLSLPQTTGARKSVVLGERWDP